MKKTLAILLTALLMLSAVSALADMSDYNIVTKADTHKVILDTDMGYFGDDTYALMILLQADKAGYLDLLGVTSVGANTTIAQGTTPSSTSSKRWAVATSPWLWAPTFRLWV